MSKRLVAVFLHPKTEQTLASFRAELPHAILLSGKPGVGLATVAKDLAGKDLAAFIEPTDKKGIIDHEAGTIGVDSIRNLYEQTRSKHLTRQVFIIDDADHMSPGAQAAFLKLLEEPTPHTHFILTSHFPQRVLPTVRSRVQAVIIEPITVEQTKNLLAPFGTLDPKMKAQLEYLGRGLPAELLRLVKDPDYFKQRADIMADTKLFLTGSLYQRLLIIHKYYQSKQKTLQLLDAALTVSERSIKVRPQAGLTQQLDKLLEAREKIAANCNPRLQLMAFVVY